MAERLNGIVSRFENGFGFINMEHGDSIFVHWSEIVMDGFKVLEPGDRVSFNIGEGREGKQMAKYVVKQED